MNNINSFNAHYKEIEALVEKKRSMWTFKADLMMDFDDVKSMIISHIWKKWDQYDPDRPLANWVSRIVKHKFLNILRDRYLSTSSPCAKCPCNIGGNLCSVYGEQGTDCELYNKWWKTKKHAHDVRLPLPMENHINEIYEMPHETIDVEKAAEILHDKIKIKLTDSEWQIYYRLYIEHKDEETTASELKLKTTEKGRKIGYKRIRAVKTKVIKTVKTMIAQDGIESLYS